MYLRHTMLLVLLCYAVPIVVIHPSVDYFFGEPSLFGLSEPYQNLSEPYQNMIQH